MPPKSTTDSNTKPSVNTNEDFQKKQKTRPAPTPITTKDVTQTSSKSTEEPISQPTKQQKTQQTKAVKQQPKQPSVNNDHQLVQLGTDKQPTTPTKSPQQQPQSKSIDTKSKDNNENKNKNGTKPEQQQSKPTNDKKDKNDNNKKDNNNNNNNNNNTTTKSITTSSTTEGTTTTTTPPPTTEKKQKVKPALPTLPLSLPITTIVTDQLLNTKLPQSITQPQRQLDPSKIHDPSLQYYQNPLHAPIIKEASAYFASLHSKKYLLDWDKKVDTTIINQYEEKMKSTPSAPSTTVHSQLYNYQSHFDSCEMCRTSTHVTKYTEPVNKTTSSSSTAKSTNSSSSTTTTTTTPEPVTRYPFRVIMDNKDMWRTHGKFAVRPCSDHNIHLNLNKTPDNIYRPPAPTTTTNETDENGEPIETKNTYRPREEKNPDNYGKKNISKGSALLYRHVEPCQCGQPHIGLFSEGTRCITPHITHSPSHHPLLNYALKLVQEAITKSNIQPFSDIDGAGFLRYVVISVPNTFENNLYQQWYIETHNGTRQWKIDPKNNQPKSITQKISYPQVQLSLIWNEGINDTIKKLKNIIEVEPVMNLPFPYALDELKRPLYKPSFDPNAKKGNNNNNNNNKKDDNKKDTKQPTTTTPKPHNLIKTDIPYAEERHESRKALYSFIKTLLTEFKTVQKSFIQYANYHGYDVITESLWQKECGYAFQDQNDQTILDKQPEEYTTILRNKEYNFSTHYASIPIPTILSNDDTEPIILPYTAPICRQCNLSHTSHDVTKIIKPNLSRTIQGEFKTNPKSLTMPVLDTLNTTPTCLWGSIFVHYNNGWSHSNSVYSLHKDSWHHIFGKHSIDENVMNNGIPLSSIDYNESCKHLRLHSSGIKTQNNKNTVMKFDDDSDDDDDDQDIKKVNDTKKVNDNKKGKHNNKKEIIPITQTTSTALPKFSFSPSVFRQGNLNAFSHLLHHLLTLLPTNTKHIVEMHSGCGTISLHTLHHTQLLTASDVNANNKVTFQHATSQLNNNNNNNNTTEQQHASILYDKKVLPYIPLSSDQLMKENIAFADVVIVDPPRKGLDETTLQHLSLPWVDARTLYPNKQGHVTIGGIQPYPTVFPFDLSSQLYVNRHANKQQQSSTMNDGGDDDNDDKTNNNNNIDRSGSSVNKNSRDKKKWMIEYSKIISTHEKEGTTLYGNTKEHHLEQLNKSNNDNKREFSKSSSSSSANDIIKLPHVNGIHWLQTSKVLLYVSCGFQAFKHDCDILVNGPGNWKIAHTHAHLLFPGSNHIETLTVFVRGMD